MAEQRERKAVWRMMLDEFESEEAFREAVMAELMGLENMGHRGGRGFVVSPIRRPDTRTEPWLWETIGWVFREATALSVPAQQQQEHAERPVEYVPEATWPVPDDDAAADELDQEPVEA